MGRIIGIKDILSGRMTFRDDGSNVIAEAEMKEFREVFNFLKNKENWKLPTKVFTTSNAKLAGMVADVLMLFTGGAEISFIFGGPIKVSSKGYYHYIGV